METVQPKVTNQRVADRLGINHSTVSRIRSGERHPSIDLMKKIETEYGWDLEKQLRAYGSVVYKREFERILAEHYA